MVYTQEVLNTEALLLLINKKQVTAVGFFESAHRSACDWYWLLNSLFRLSNDICTATCISLKIIGVSTYL